MDIYSLLREFADSWALLVMFLIVFATWGWAFRPGSKEMHDDIAQIPLRNDITLPGDKARDKQTDEAGS